MILGFSGICHAQPAAPPKVLLLVRQQYKPGMAEARARWERATSAIYNLLEIPVYWMEMEALTGPSEAVFFDPFDSFEAVEKAGAVLRPLYDLVPDLARLQSGVEGTLASSRTILALRRDSPGVDGINLAQAQFIRMLVVRARPGEAAATVGDGRTSVAYDVVSGMSGPALLIFQAMTEFTGIPAQPAAHGTVLEDSVYTVDPRMSHVSRDFAGQGRELWTTP